MAGATDQQMDIPAYMKPSVSGVSDDLIVAHIEPHPAKSSIAYRMD